MTTTTEKQRVGTCPLCRVPIFAEVDLVVEAGKPYLLSGETRWGAHASVQMVAVRAEHQCTRPTEDDEEED